MRRDGRAHREGRDEDAMSDMRSKVDMRDEEAEAPHETQWRNAITVMDETIEQEDECARVKRCKGEADEETAPADEETAMMPPPEARCMDEELESLFLESAMMDGEAEVEESEWAARVRRERAVRRALAESSRIRLML